MTIVLHKDKIAHGKRVFHMYLLLKDTQIVAVSFECVPVFRKQLDIQMILQLSGCLPAKNICKHNTFSMCDLRLCNTAAIPTW